MATQSSSVIFQAIPTNLLGGIITINAFNILSILALFVVILRLIWLAIPSLRGADRSREFTFFHSQLGYYSANLLLADLIIDISGLINLPWLFQKGITAGPLCNVQAITMQIGNCLAAYFTVTIAAHTFLSLVLRKKQNALIGGMIIVFGWLASIAIAILPAIGRPLYGPSGVTCAIRPEFTQSQFLLHLLPICVAAAFSGLLYGLLFLVLRGTLVVKGGFRLELDSQKRLSRHVNSMEDYHQFVKTIAKSMMMYPVAYVVLLVPYSVIRLFEVSGTAVPFWSLVVASICWFLIGVVNVALLYNTFRVLSPIIDARSTRRDVEQYGSQEKFEKVPYSPSFVSGGFSSIQEKALAQVQPPPRAQQNSQPRPLILSHVKSASQASSVYSYSSARHLNPSRSSEYDDSHIGRAIVSNEELTRQMMSSPQPSHSRVGHLRQESVSSVSSTGLPISPRYLRTTATTAASRSNGASSPSRAPISDRNGYPTRRPIVASAGVRGSFGPSSPATLSSSPPTTPRPAYSPTPRSPQSFARQPRANAAVPRDINDSNRASLGAVSGPAEAYRASYFETYYGASYVPSSSPVHWRTKQPSTTGNPPTRRPSA